MQEVIIIGGKGTAINIAEQIEDARRRFNYPMRVAGFAMDNPTLGSNIGGFPVVCGTRDVQGEVAGGHLKCIFALYRPDVMRERFDLLRSFAIPRHSFVNFVHPLAYVSSSAHLGVGNAVLCHACLESQVRVGDYNIVNSNLVIEHEAAEGGPRPLDRAHASSSAGGSSRGPLLVAARAGPGGGMARALAVARLTRRRRGVRSPKSPPLARCKNL